MKNIAKILTLAACVFAVAGSARAQDSVTGKWHAQFDSQIGQQNYTFDLKVEGTNLTGHAIGVRENGTNEVTIAEGSVTTNGISFVEPLKIQDNDVRIEYTGKLSGDELKLHRKVGDFAEYDIVAKRVKAGETPSGSKMDTNAPATKP